MFEFTGIIRFFLGQKLGYLAILLLLLGGIAVPMRAQILVAGTDFNASAGKENEYYVASDNIDQYGVSAGSLIPGAPWVSGTLDKFNNSYQYLVINNPVKIDSSRFKDLVIPDYMFVVSPPTTSPSTILEYVVSDMRPGTTASVTMSFCSIVDEVKAGNTNPTFNCVGQQAGFKLNIGQQNDPNKVDRDYQIAMGNCTTIVVTATVDAAGEVPIKLIANRQGLCVGLGISKIEVTGFIKAEGYAEQGVEVCAGELITLKPKIPYSGTFKWQINNSGTWTDLGALSAQNYETKAVGNYQFRYILTPSTGGASITSEIINVSAIKCCEDGNGVASSRQTIYYDDFGTLTDLTGTSYKVWDYLTDPTNPKQVVKTTSTPFRWPLESDPPGSKFVGDRNLPGGKPLVDGEYTVAAYLTGTQRYNNVDGALLSWANQVTGPASSGNIAYDHSGGLMGAALFLNNPFNSSGNIVYRRDITNLCTTNGKTIYFECYVAVFTISQNGVDITVRLKGGGTPVDLNAQACKAGTNCGGFTGGQWIRISGSVVLTGNSLTMEIINNAPDAWNNSGNDLVLDDIKIMACAPPTIDLVFDKGSLSKADKFCTKADVFATPTENFKKYFNNIPFYMYQWTLTPEDFTSWKNLGSAPSTTETYSQPDLKLLPPTALVNGKKIYFRVVAGLQSTFTDRNNFVGTGNFANLNDPCRNYSVSAAIEATVQCPICLLPGSIEKDQTLCDDNVSQPKAILSVQPAATSTAPSIDYQWQSASLPTGPWTDLGITTIDLSTPPKPSGSILYIRRRATTGGTTACDSAFTTPVKITKLAPPIAEILSPLGIISSTPPTTKITTTRSPSIWIQAANPGTLYEGTWTVANGGTPTGLKNGNVKALTDSLLLKNFGDTTTAIWTVRDKDNVCPSSNVRLRVIRKNFTTPNAGPDDTICITGVGAYQLLGNDFTVGDEVATWGVWKSTPTGAAITSLNAKQTNFNVPGPGIYEFFYTIHNTVLGIKDTDRVVITVDAEVEQPMLPRPDTSICTTQIKLEASGAKPSPTARGIWRPAVGQVFTNQAIEVPNDPKSWFNTIPLGSVTNLTWEVRNGVCPAKSVNFTVNQVGLLSNPTISLNGTLIKGTDTTLCDGVAYVLTTNALLAGEAGAWAAIPSGSSISISEGTSTSQPVTINSEGNTNVEWTMSKNSCPDAARKVTLRVFKKPILQPLSGPTLCEDQSAFYLAKSVLPITNDTLKIITYNWYTTPNTPTGSFGVATIQGANNLAIGTFKFSSTATTGPTDRATIYVTAANACGISDPIGLEVAINLRPRDYAGPILGDLVICESSTIDRKYTIPVQAGNVSVVNWTLDNTTLSVASQPAIETTIPISKLVSTTTSKKLKVQLENACGKGVKDSIKITITPATPVIADLAGFDTVCLPRDAFVYRGNSSNGGTNATYYFEIVHPDGSIGKKQNASTTKSFPLTIGDVKDGSKIRLQVIGDPVDGCFIGGSGRDSLIIDGYEYPDTNLVLNGSNDTICAGNAIQFCIGVPKKGNTTYIWYQDNVVVKTGLTPDRCGPSLTARLQSGLYKVKVDNEVCGPLTSGNHRARIFDSPNVQFVPDEVLFEIATSPSLPLSAQIGGLTGDVLTSIEWTPTDLLSSPTTGSLNTTFTPPPTGGRYVYTITVETGEGRIYCRSDASIKIFALPPVVVPNAFSPNNDGLNELWQIDGIDAYPRAKVSVFNRWGNKMFESTPYNGLNGWDGTTNGNKLPMGTYYFVIDLAENVVIQSRYLTGSLTIVY